MFGDFYVSQGRKSLWENNLTKAVAHTFAFPIPLILLIILIQNISVMPKTKGWNILMICLELWKPNEDAPNSDSGKIRNWFLSISTRWDITFSLWSLFDATPMGFEWWGLILFAVLAEPEIWGGLIPRHSSNIVNYSAGRGEPPRIIPYMSRRSKYQ